MGLTPMTLLCVPTSTGSFSYFDTLPLCFHSIYMAVYMEIIHSRSLARRLHKLPGWGYPFPEIIAVV
jgi:hypothetical protein